MSTLAFCNKKKTEKTIEVIKQQKRKEKEDKRAQQVADSFIVVERTTQKLLDK
jgi:hypothetical protein